jgi:NADPH-dependent ferric siderophore reductase
MSKTPPVGTRPVPDHMFGGRLTGSYFLDLEVIGVDEIAEHVRLVKVASSDLVGFKYEPGQDLLFEFPDGDRTLRRRYTIRRSDPEKGTADFEFEMHRGSGPATRWVAKAQAGQRLEAIGPRGAVKVRSEAATHLFVVDDAAVPAAFSMLDTFPANMSAIALLVTSHGAKSRPTVAGRRGTSLVWLGQEEIVNELNDLYLPADTAVYVFGERQLVRLVEEILVEDGVDRDAIASKAYWRLDQPNAGHGEPSFN